MNEISMIIIVLESMDGIYTNNFELRNLVESPLTVRKCSFSQFRSWQSCMQPYRSCASNKMGKSIN